MVTCLDALVKVFLLQHKGGLSVRKGRRSAKTRGQLEERQVEHGGHDRLIIEQSYYCLISLVLCSSF